MFVKNQKSITFLFSSCSMQVNTQAPSNVTDCSDRNYSKYYVVVVQVLSVFLSTNDWIYTAVISMLGTFICSILLDLMLRLWRTFFMHLMMGEYQRRNSTVSYYLTSWNFHVEVFSFKRPLVYYLLISLSFRVSTICCKTWSKLAVYRRFCS